jgi:integrase
VLRVIEPIWLAKTVTANRVRNRIEVILDWSAVRGYRTGDNPARWKGHLDHLLPSIKKREHYAALPYTEIAQFMRDLRVQSNLAASPHTLTDARAPYQSIAACALEFLILTAARTGEVTGARWSEIDLAAQVWTIPAQRMKGGREHRVPLSQRAVDLLAKIKPTSSRELGGLINSEPAGLINGYVFANKQLPALSLARVLKQLRPAGSITVHGFRSSFRDWAAERTNYQNHVVEMALAHAISGAVEAAYRRGELFDKRRRLMNEWARYCTTQQKTAAVVPMRQR